MGDIKVKALLTSTEVDVVEKMIDGLNNKQIAESRSVSVRTIGIVVSTIYRKLNVNGRNALFSWWFRNIPQKRE